MPKLINIEGIDGTGKHTVALALKDKLEQEHLSVFMTDFPAYETPTGKVVKEFLQGNLIGDSKKSPPYISSMLYTVDRLVYFQNHSREMYDADVIISDRSYMSNLFYQASKSIHIRSSIRSTSQYDFNICRFLSSYMKFMTTVEIEMSPLYHISPIDVLNVYLFHNDIKINEQFMNKRAEEEPSRARDLNENMEYLKTVNNFALNLHRVANSILDKNYYKQVFAHFPYYVYSTVCCTSGIEVKTPDTIAGEIADTAMDMIVTNRNPNLRPYENTVMDSEFDEILNHLSDANWRY